MKGRLFAAPAPAAPAGFAGLAGLVGLAFAGAIGLGACSKGDQVTVRIVNLHTPASCPLPSRTQGFYTAAGDFPADPGGKPLFLDDVGTDLTGIPAAVRSLALVGQQTNTTPPSQWTGVTLVPPTGDVDMLVLPLAAPCALSAKVGFVAGTPDASGRPEPDMIVGAVDAHTMIVLGADKLPASFRVNLDTGQVTKMPTGIQTARKRAPLVATGDGGAIVAGGVTQSTPTTLQNWELYDPLVQDFVPGNFPLKLPRADHAAVRLDSGDVLLVGGQSGGVLVPELEIVHVAARSTELLPTKLAEPRTRPTALRLADGTILVGGGYLANGSPATTFEFLTADGRGFAPNIPTVTIQQMRARHAIVAVDGGGALVVNVPDATDPPTFQNAWNITPQGAVAVPVPSIFAIGDAKLFPGADGRPVLWAGDRWLTFDPWSTTQTWSAVDADSGIAGPADDSPTASPDPGMFAWVATDGTVFVRRLSTRNEFVTDPQPYLVGSKDHLVPDRWSPTMTFDTSLFLPSGAAAFVADARFLDVTIDLDAPDGGVPASGGVPHVVLRDESGTEIEVGGTTCPFVAPPLPTHLHVERVGGAVSYRFGAIGAANTSGDAGGAPLIACQSAGVSISPGERVAVGLRAASTDARAKSLEILR